jgi:hypothetical protein
MEIVLMPVSMHGLDLSWMQDPANRLPPSPPKPRRINFKRSSLPTPYFMPDVDAAYGGAWKSIVDGSEISSRSNWREHDKRNEVINVGADFWAKDGDDVAYTREKMGYDPSLIGKKDDGDGVEFGWKDPA